MILLFTVEHCWDYEFRNANVIDEKHSKKHA